jgi:hypothetical protein
MLCEETVMLNPWVQLIVTIVGTIAASSGFWAYIQRRDTSKNMNQQLMLGLAYDKIISMGLDYIARGWITSEEYDDYRRKLYDPYKALGGNGVTERVVAAVTDLPLKPREKYVTVLNDAKTRSVDGSTRTTDDAE